MAAGAPVDYHGRKARTAPTTGLRSTPITGEYTSLWFHVEGDGSFAVHRDYFYPAGGARARRARGHRTSRSGSRAWSTTSAGRSKRRYGNATTDVTAYQSINVPEDRQFIVGGLLQAGTTVIPNHDFTDHIASFVEVQPDNE